MTIYDLLIQDHKKVKDLLSQMSKEFDYELFEELKKEVTIHSEAEEEAFYEPLERKAKNLKIAIECAHTEHDLVMDMMDSIDECDDDEEVAILLSILKKNLEAHILMEEADIFNLSKKVFSDEEAEQMGKDMAKAKEKMTEEYQSE